jgi:hypothetical protein
MREIVDIRTEEEITLNFPYMKPYNWIGANELTDDLSIGRVGVTILNSLKVTPTCSTTMEVLVYASAGDDFEFACPAPTGGLPYVPEALTIGGEIKQDTSSDHNLSSIGDPVKSIKQLLNIVTNFNMSVAEILRCNIYGHSLSLPTTNVNVNNTLVKPLIFNDYINIFASGYVFSRGGVRIVMPLVASDGLTLNRLLPMLGTQSYTTGTQSSFGIPNTDSTYSMNAGLTALTYNSRGGTDVIIPHAGQTPIRLNAYQTAQTGNCYNHLQWENPYMLTVYQRGTQQLQGLYRSAADDYELGYFIGFPPYLYSLI